MPQSLSNLYVHIVFSTKGRARLLQNKGMRKEMHAYIATLFKEYESPVVIVGGIEDHVHILCNLSRKHALSTVIKETKRKSTRWINRKLALESHFSWQNGYGAFSVSKSRVKEVTEYISNQEERHKKISFQDELRALLRKQELEFDENYIWD